MKVWNVILATIVIFAAGAVTGGLLVKTMTPQPPPVRAAVPPIISQQQFQDKLKRELELTAEQTNRIDRIFQESNARIRILWDLVGPEMQKERQEVHDNIIAILNSEQREKFEEMLKKARHRDGRRGRGTNAPISSNAAPDKMRD